VDFCEVRVEDLIRTMKDIVALGRGRLACKADAGMRVAHGRFTWERSAERAADCLRELKGKVPLRVERSRREAEQGYRRFEAARRLLLERDIRRGSERQGFTAT